MNKCLTCGKDTKNPKFCSRSCSVSNNNKGIRRHGKEPTRSNCLFCKQEIINKKFCCLSCQKKYQWEVDRKRFWCNDQHTFVSSKIKKFILDEREYKCESCENTYWLDQKIPLELEHIDGNSENNDPSNLKLLCPNCHALTPTYKAKNKGNGRYYRRKRYKEGKSF